VYVARGQATFSATTGPGEGIWGNFTYDSADASVTPAFTPADSGCGSTGSCRVRGSVFAQTLGPKVLNPDPVPSCTTQTALPDGTPFPAGSRDASGYSTATYVAANITGLISGDYPSGGTAGYLKTKQ